EAASSFDVEFRIQRHDGVYRWFKTRASALRDSQGRVIKWFGTNTDIDDLRQTEQALRDREIKAHERDADQRFLLKLGAALQTTTNPCTIGQNAARLVGEYLNADRCGWMTIDQRRGDFTIQYEHRQSGKDSLVGSYRLDIWGDIDFLAVLASGQTLAVDAT